MKSHIFLTEVVRTFANWINRVVYGGHDVTPVRGESAVARVVPPPQAGRLGDLPVILASVPGLGPSEASVFADDLRKARDELAGGPELEDWSEV